MNQTPVHLVRRAVVLSAASFGVLGGCLTLPGTLLPLLVERFGIRLVEAGSMLALLPVGYLLAVTVAGGLIEAYGMQRVLAAGMLTSAAGFTGFGLISSWTGGAVMMLIGGLGFGVMEVGTNTLLIVAGGERRSNLLNLAHLFFGVGSFITPVLAAHAVAAGVSWRTHLPRSGRGDRRRCGRVGALRCSACRRGTSGRRQHTQRGALTFGAPLRGHAWRVRRNRDRYRWLAHQVHGHSPSGDAHLRRQRALSVLARSGRRAAGAERGLASRS